MNAGLVFGHGTVHVGGDLRNRASIRADGGTLTFNADPGVTLDLDGNQEDIALGKLRAREGNLEFNAPLRDALLSNGDPYMHLADLRSYLDADRMLLKLYTRPDDWARTAILNIAASGKFSSDRTIAEYANEVWHATPCPVP